MSRILVIEDDQSISELVKINLELLGHQVITAPDGIKGLAMAQQNTPDLIVLDVMLPGMDGVEVLTRLRRESDVYIILLTAKTEEMDRILGLTVGADDYVTKPFSPRELTARIKSALRRIHNVGKSKDARSVLSFQHILIDIGARKVTVDNNPIELTAIEFDLLKSLAENSGRVLSREQLLENVWGESYFGETRVVDVHLGHVRKKLGRDDLIVTVRGVGYRFEDKRL